MNLRARKILQGALGNQQKSSGLVHARKSIASGLAFLGRGVIPALFLSACAGEDPQLQRAPEIVDRSLQGELQFRLQGMQALVSALELRVYRSNGSEVASGIIPVQPGQDVASSALVLPAGLGYTMTLVGQNKQGVTCTGSTIFNVIAGKSTQLRLALVCEAPNPGSSDGSVRIEVEVGGGEAGACPEISFVSKLPQTLNVGGSIKLRSAASHAGTAFRWSASSGRFSTPQAADTDFECTEVGPATLTLAVGLGPGCEKQHQISVDCLATEGGGDTGGSSGSGGGDPDGGTGEDSSGTDSSGTEPENKDNSEREVRRIRFQPSVGGQTFECGRSYSDLGSTQVKGTVSDFRFYVHQMHLITTDGREVPFAIEDRGEWQGSGVALIDFEGGPDSGCYGGTPGVNTEVTGIAPAGNYRGLRFSIGVPPALSHADPSTLEGPLTAGGMAWSWLAGYKFLKFELGSGLLHVGSTGCTGTPPDKIKCSRANRPEITLPNFDPHTQAVHTDIAAAFRTSDLEQHPSCHSTGDACAPLFQEVGLNFEDGSVIDTQSVFSAR